MGIRHILFGFTAYILSGNLFHYGFDIPQLYSEGMASIVFLLTILYFRETGEDNNG